MPSSPSPFVLGSGGWRARVERLLDGVARQRVAISLVAFLALAAAGVLWLSARPHLAGPPPAPAPAAGTGGGGQLLPRVEAGGQGGAGAPSGTVQGGATVQGGGTALIAVDVVGQVRHPGLVQLPQGSRVLDAIEAAGGAGPGAELEAVNLARRVVDGEQIRVPRHGEPVAAAGAAGGPGASGPSGQGGVAGPGQQGAPLDLNTATVDQLEALPGIGEVTASQIVAYRSAHLFTSVDDLRQVPGIGDRRFELLKDLVTVSGAS